MSALPNSSVGLVRYDAMCKAIAECHRVDEVKALRDKARALEVYAQQALNREAERQAASIRIRAERRAGELLRDMKETGQRDAGGRGKIGSRDTTQLADLGITKDQSSKWQQLAAVPTEEFERAVNGDGPRPTTEGIIHAHAPSTQTAIPRMDPDALHFWGTLRDFERRELFAGSVNELVAHMTQSMRDDCRRLVPRLIDWLALFER